MARQIYIVNANIVDETGKHSIPDGYPKSFDSKNYGGDVDKTLKRAESDWHNLLKGFGTQDTRKLQYATVETADGFQIRRDGYGTLSEPEPEPEPEPSLQE